MKKKFFLSLLMLPLLLVSRPPMETEAAYTPYQIPNGGFEDGNLSGWRSYMLWKNETGIAAFDSSLVHGGTYFSSYPYGRDGNYQLGITSGSITWDQSTERMGYLRSSDFILGGSGWISFKLGGGRTPSFAYMSVRKVSDDTEVARFGNRHFNNTAIATTQYGSLITNAEAFLFQYYFNMTSVVSLGEYLYILLCDTSAWDWSILSADSFVTYIAEEPSPSVNQTATNILPSILGIDTADNTIKNGNFDTDLSNWSLSSDNTTNGWGRSSSNADIRSNRITGDADVGIIRSSAFTVTTNKYLKFNWAGGLRYDKQIFVSIKEVGTNIEKLRFVRRDNLSTKESFDFDNHICDLSSLSSSKKYYIEFADARTGGWGISYVDTVRTSSDNNPAGDRAVSISNLPLTFEMNYIQEAASYGAYFLQQTAPYCTELNGVNIPWSTLATEYETLSDSAKNYFVGTVTDTEIIGARERYLYLIDAYSAFTANKFMVNSLGAPYTGIIDPVLPPVINPSQNSAALLIIVAITFALAGGTAYIYKRKQRSYL